MDATALATFLAVARQGSVTGAALELHTVQSNVTARMKQLEADFHVPLFARHSRGVRLTPAGFRLVVYAERMQALAAEAHAAVSDVGVVTGVLRMGSMETTAAVRLPQLLARFYRAYPEVQIELRTGPTAELLEHVLAHRLDGALVAGPIHHPDLVARLAFREELVLVTARGSATISERLAQGVLTVITFRQGCSYRQRLDAEFITRGWLPYRRLEMGTVEGILGCVGANVGVTVLPRSVVEASPGRDTLQVDAFAPDPLFVETLFVRRRSVSVNTTMAAFEQRLCLPQ
jgi:LysR family transcriptional regulator, cell division regulator